MIRLTIPNVDLERSWFRLIQDQLPERFAGHVEALIDPVNPDIEVDILGIRFGDREIGCYLLLEQSVRMQVRSFYMNAAREGLEGDAPLEIA